MHHILNTYFTGGIIMLPVVGHDKLKLIFWTNDIIMVLVNHTEDYYLYSNFCMNFLFENQRCIFHSVSGIF